MISQIQSCPYKPLVDEEQLDTIAMKSTTAHSRVGDYDPTGGLLGAASELPYAIRPYLLIQYTSVRLIIE